MVPAVQGAVLTKNPGDAWNLAALNPGDTLQLTDGVHGPITFYCGQDGIQQGTASQPITIRAQNTTQRRAVIYTNGTVPAMHAIVEKYDIELRFAKNQFDFLEQYRVGYEARGGKAGNEGLPREPLFNLGIVVAGDGVADEQDAR